MIMRPMRRCNQRFCDALESLVDRLRNRESFICNIRQLRFFFFFFCLDSTYENRCSAIRLLCKDLNMSCGAVQIIIERWDKQEWTDTGAMLKQRGCYFGNDIIET